LPTKGVELDIAKGLLTLSPEAQTSLGTKTTPTALQTLDQKSLAYATLITPWQQQYFLTSQVSGRITALFVNSGELVDAGQVLAEIESPEIEMIRLELREATIAMDLAEQEMQRLERLTQVVAGRELLEVTSKYEQQKTAVQIARVKLTSLGVPESALNELSNSPNTNAPLRLPLVSNIRGYVSHADLSVGKVVTANEHLFEINDISKLWVKIGVLEKDHAKIQVGQRVEIQFAALPNHAVETTVSVVGNYVDPITHVADVWAEISNDDDNSDYLPGMYGTAKITTAGDDTLLTIPSSSLLGSGAERYVLVEMASTAKGQEYRKQNVVLESANSKIEQIREGA
jgi:cobalt-zinc-cadmium efflux system membrane fusion protein